MKTSHKGSGLIGLSELDMMSGIRVIDVLNRWGIEMLFRLFDVFCNVGGHFEVVSAVVDEEKKEDRNRLELSYIYMSESHPCGRSRLGNLGTVDSENALVPHSNALSRMVSFHDSHEE